MKLTCTQKDLNEALVTVSKAINANNTLPVLNNVLLRAKEGKLYFSATNLEIAINFTINADVKNEGTITVPAKLLTSYVGFLSDEKIDIQVEEGVTLTVKSKSSQTKIKGINADEFPSIPEAELGSVIDVGAEDLENAISQTIFAVSSNTSRPVLSGVFFTTDKVGLKLVSTDSYRLAEKTLKLKKKPNEDVSCIIPFRTLSELGKILTHFHGKAVSINISKNQVLFSVGCVELVSRLIEGAFPDYEKIIPKSSITKILVDANTLSLTLRRISLFARENNNNIRLAATNDGKINISTDETRVGEEKTTIDADVKGDNNKVSLNAQYLLDVVTHYEGEKVLIELGEKLAPVAVRPEKRNDYTYIIMPLKV